MTRFVRLALLLAGVCLAPPAWAQINPFHGTSATPLTQQDLAALNDASTRLLNHPQLTAGDTETWRNDASGASGSVTAGATAHRHGLACRVLNYDASVPGPRPDRMATLTWCKTKTGWKIG